MGGGDRENRKLLNTCSWVPLEKDELQLGVAEAKCRKSGTNSRLARQSESKQGLPGRKARGEFRWDAGRLPTRCQEEIK